LPFKVRKHKANAYTTNRHVKPLYYYNLQPGYPKIFHSIFNNTIKRRIRRLAELSATITAKNSANTSEEINKSYVNFKATRLQYRFLPIFMKTLKKNSNAYIKLSYVQNK
jgi:hypothetical protein